MPKPRLIRPPAYWEKKIWDMKWENLPDFRPRFLDPDDEPMEADLVDFYDSFTRRD